MRVKEPAWEAQVRSINGASTVLVKVRAESATIAAQKARRIAHRKNPKVLGIRGSTADDWHVIFVRLKSEYHNRLHELA